MGALLGTPTMLTITLKSEDGTANERYVAQVYQDLLLRPVDLGGLAFWSGQLDAHMPQATVARSLAHSAEYYATNIVRPAYLQFLGRPADADGLSFWVGQLQGGVTDEQLQAGFIA